MSFNAKKCKILHLGHNNKNHYYINELGTPKLLEKSVVERELGVLKHTYKSTMPQSSQQSKQSPMHYY